MDMLRADWLPLRFWLAALGSISILLVSLMAVGAIDDDPEPDKPPAAHALLRDADKVLCTSPGPVSEAAHRR
jgi:hypothetical protein